MTKRAPIYLLIGLGVLILASALVLITSPLKASKTLAPYNSAFDSYLSAFTAGEVSKQSDVKIRFAMPMVDSTQVGQDLPAKWFKISPSNKGQISWHDTRTLIFKPAESLESHTLYKVSMEMDAIIPDIDPTLNNFSFYFRTQPQSFKIEMLGNESSEDDQSRFQKVRGLVRALDVENGEEVEKIVSAKLAGKPVHINWSHDPEAKVYSFEIDSLERQLDAQELQIKWDASEIGLKGSGEENIDIAALGNFQTSQVLAFNGNNPYIKIEFSEPLQPTQNLNGLIRLGTSAFTYLIEGNHVKVFPKRRPQGNVQVEVLSGIENRKGHRTQVDFSKTLSFESEKPALKLVGKGVIIPQSKNLPFIFEAVGLTAVNVRVIRIYEDNIQQFLQINRLGEEKELKRTGRIVAQKTISLDRKLDLRSWNTHAIDLSSLINTEPGAIYQVAIGFQKSQYIDACETQQRVVTQNMKPEKDMLAVDWDWDTYEEEAEDSYWGYWEEDYRYDNRNNPCKDEYYHSGRVIKRNVLASDLGLIAKKGDNEMFIAITDLKTTAPKSNVKLEVYNYQQQLLTSATTNENGIADLRLNKTPYLLIAKSGKQRGYLRLDDGSSLSLSRFDIQGVTYHKGIKGYIYGERGVWRPGDDIFLNFILEDKDNNLPDEHPVVFELFNPKGQRVDHIVRNSGVGGIYSFQTQTASDAPTGNYLGRIKVGGATFEKTLKVETIVPNRLKLLLDFGVDALSNETRSLKSELAVTWLHGAIARNMDTEVKVTLKQGRTSFPKYLDYNFNDPSRRFNSEEKVLFTGKLDDNGKAEIPVNIQASSAAPGQLVANFLGRVMEPGGNVSTDRFSLPFHPYDVYAGVKLPKGDVARGMLLTDTDHDVKIVTVDKKGNPVSRTGVRVKLYKLNWKWWWDKSADEDLGAYIGRNHSHLIDEGTINTVDGKGVWKLRINYPQWGRYMVHVEEPGGHATGKIVYIDWPGWAGRAQSDNPGGAKMLVFAADKSTYQVGEKATLTIPSGQDGRALVSIEAGNRVITSYWVDAEKGSTQFSFPITEEMAPNVYAHVSLLQPHAQTKNDLPMRLYGVIPLKVEDPKTKLQPVLTMADQLEPMEEVVIKVGEKNGGPMAYTVAVVDEGLLGLTRYRTPNPHGHFYRREALKVKTWDLFDDVVGAYGGELTSLLSIGGDGDAAGADGKKPDRFKPVVKVLGPFILKKGETRTHRFMMPNYIGAVRTMVVASHEGAYGKVDKETPVKKPLMALGTLPRVLGPGEEIQLPVSIFALEDYIKNVSIQVETNGMFEKLGSSTQSMTFSDVGEKMATFGLKVKEEIGTGYVKITARSGSEVAVYETDILVRPSNPRLYRSYASVIQPGESWKRRFRPVGMSGTNNGVLEITNIPPINLGKRLQYLIRYPYGCIEQTTSSVFPQVYLSTLMELSDEQKDQIDNNIRAGIQRLQSFQIGNGGLAYWPGNGDASEWGTNYAGNFLLEASEAGYTIPEGFLQKWISFQTERARNWSYSNQRGSDVTQAYRLYLLALANAEDMGSMNRMRQATNNLSIQAKWYLAAAYHLVGQGDMARRLTKELSKQIPEYVELGNTFGSSIRDKALIVQALAAMNRRDEAADLIQQLSDRLCEDKWMNTQATAYALVAVAKYVGKNGMSKTMNFSYAVNNGKLTSKSYEKALWQTAVASESNGQVEIKNSGKSLLFTRLILDGVPFREDTAQVAAGLRVNVVYADRNGEALDVSRVLQGEDLTATVSVTNTGTRGHYSELALEQVFPAGWEIHNHRLDGSDTGSSALDYQDIRDDRVYSFMDLGQGQTKVIHVKLTASYLGKYYLPAVSVHAMYDKSINARKPGKWVEVVSQIGD